MALSAPPFAAQNGSHSAALFRQAVGSAFWQASGVLGAQDFGVTAQATPNMSVQVNPGQAWVQGTSTGLISGIGVGAQGSYYVLSDTAATLTIAAANASNPRIDNVYLRVLDTSFGDASNSAILGVVTGTPAVTPAVPALPANALSLAHVTVPAAATSIVGSNIAYSSRDGGQLNIAQMATPAAPVLFTQESTMPSFASRDPALGQLVMTDLYNLYCHIGGGDWQLLNSGEGYTTVSQSVAQTGIAANTYTVINCDQGESGAWGDGVGITIPANQAGFYLIDGCVSATNFASAAEFTSLLQVNGSYPAAAQGARFAATSAGSSYHSAAVLGARVMHLNAGDVIRLVAFAGATFDTWASQTNISSWLSVARVAGGQKAVG